MKQGSHAASIRPLHSKKYGIEEALEEVRSGKLVGPFNSTKELIAELLS